MAVPDRGTGKVRSDGELPSAGGVVLSVLDQSPIAEGSSGADALRNSVDLARFTEQLGYHRYWVAEHHGTPMLACAAPEVLIAALASATERIRVGSGGVMLPHYSPLKVAEVFSMLAALFPDRIDLALGRAAGTDPITTFALQRDRRQASPDDFPSQLAELLGYFNDALPEDHPFRRLSLLPGRPHKPDVWLLGSSAQSRLWADETGLPYAFADFINPMKTRADIVAVTAVCADTEEEAWRLSASSRMVFTLLREGKLIEVPPVETALRFFEERGLPYDAVPAGRRAIIGTRDKVRAEIERVAQEYGASEVMVVTITYDHDARKRSYELIA
jgi:alkanesulfonate monooxygenase SsuD/methylene tetrahydromethanopterin reductase-like flavin-dependent oxidoreductase (luciferase family)